MWFDVQAALAEIHADEKRLSNSTPRATTATTATQAPGTLPVSHMSHMSHTPNDLEAANSASWDAIDWQAYYDERAGVAEFDGAIPRTQAEQQAWQCCIAEWLCQHPVTSEPGSCAQCGRGDLTYGPVMPYGDAIHGHTWLHGECWPAWYAHRRQDAIAALAGFGIGGGE